MSGPVGPAGPPEEGHTVLGIDPNVVIDYVIWSVTAMAAVVLAVSIMRLVVASSQREYTNAISPIVGSAVIAVSGCLFAAFRSGSIGVDWELVSRIVLIIMGVVVLVGGTVAAVKTTRTITRKRARSKAAAIENIQLELLASRNQLAGMKSAGAIQDSHWLDEQIKLAGIGGE